MELIQGNPISDLYVGIEELVNDAVNNNALPQKMGEKFMTDCDILSNRGLPESETIELMESVFSDVQEEIAAYQEEKNFQDAKDL